jgi:predicted dienelactone hydrolase
MLRCLTRPTESNADTFYSADLEARIRASKAEGFRDYTQDLKGELFMLRAIYRTLFLTPVVVLLAVGVVNAQGDRSLDDPGQLGPYAVGHTNYRMVDKDNGNRPVFFTVWYPVDAGDIDSSTPPAEYLTDPYTDLLPPTDPYWYFTKEPTFSTDWESLGYDRAYEGPTPSNDGPFPLLMVSPAWSGDNWQYIFIGTRLASHGYVVAVLEDWADCQLPWSQCDDDLTALVNRPRDVSFAITQLLAKSRKPGQLLFRAIDPERIAASGHSNGGYAAYTLAGGDDLVCDALWPALEGQDTLPYPANTCVPTPPDRRIKAIISLDGVSSAHRYRELARISVPSLIMGETVDQLEGLDSDGSARDWSARPHAAINRDDSYRVDVNGANHYSFGTLCDAVQVWYNRGWFSSDDLAAWENSWPCASTGWDPVTIPAADAHEVVTKYMISFLDIYLGGPNKSKRLEREILTPEYALSHTPTVQFFDSEACAAYLPDHSYFRYRAFQLSRECDVAEKDPTGWFGSPAEHGKSDPTHRTPAPEGPFRPLKKHF